VGKLDRKRCLAKCFRCGGNNRTTVLASDHRMVSPGRWPADDAETPVRARSGLSGTPGGGARPGGHVEDQRQLRRHDGDGPLRPGRGRRIARGRAQPALTAAGTRGTPTPGSGPTPIRTSSSSSPRNPPAAASTQVRGAPASAPTSSRWWSVIAQNNADPKKVFAAGPSSGACMTQALLASYPDVFADSPPRRWSPCSSPSWVCCCAPGSARVAERRKTNAPHLLTGAPHLLTGFR